MKFAQVLKNLRLETGKSRYRLAEWTGLSEAYLLRLESGERSKPGREVVQLLALALMAGTDALNLYDVEELYRAAGFVPPATRSGRATSVWLLSP